MDSDGVVICIGSSNVDFIMKVPHLPARGETVTDGTFQQVFGGKGANQAVAAARAGARTTFVTCLGNDPYASLMLESFARDGIDTAHVRRADDVPSGTALVMFDADGDNYLSVAPGSNDRLMPEDLDEHAERIASADVVLLQMEIQPQTIVRALELAGRGETAVIFNYAPYRDGIVPLDGAMSWLVVNEQECAELAGVAVSSRDEAAAAQVLRQRGVQHVAVTLGANGVLLCDDAVRHLQAFRIEPKDTTAAGDTFCGMFGAALARGESPETAARLANAASALCCLGEGAQPSIPHAGAVRAFLDEHDDG